MINFIDYLNLLLKFLILLFNIFNILFLTLYLAVNILLW